MIDPPITKERQRALVDISLLALAFWGAFSLRFAGVPMAGLWTVLAGVATGAALLVWRGESWRDLGLHTGESQGFVLSRAGEFAVLALVTGGVVIGLATAVGYPPSQSSVLTQQPVALTAFVLDIVFGVWVGAALGEEIFFRGFLLTKFETLFGRGHEGRPGRLSSTLAVLAQAVWFGSGHVSQGLSGMIMAGAIGAVVGAFFLTRARRSLLPLIIGHGFVDTVSQTIHYFGES
jgi:membrane protease YdiL (CAAX protease family)